MVKKIVALVGSPRKGGNTDLLVDAFIEGAEPAGAEVDKVYLNGLKIRGCQGCLACHKDGKCRQKDDMIDLHGRLLDADVWLLATPVYWWGPTAQIKTAIDRMYCLCFGENLKKLQGKKVALITASADEPENATPHLVGMFRESFEFIKMEWAGQLLIKAHEKGEVAKDKDSLVKARKLGEEVAGN